MTPYQVNVAAESYTAVLLSQAGYDVAVQYGTTQPDWDLIATKEQRLLKLQVKGSQDGGWGLFQGHKSESVNYHEAIDAWGKSQVAEIVYVFVQFKSIAAGQLPRCYIARPSEVVLHMHTTRGGHGYTSMREAHTYSSGVGKGHTDRVPQAWLATQQRIDTI